MKTTFFLAKQQKQSFSWRRTTTSFCLLLALAMTGCVSHESNDAYYRARELHQQGNYQEAEKQLEEFVNANPESKYEQSAKYYLNDIARKNMGSSLTASPEEMRAITSGRLNAKLTQLQGIKEEEQASKEPEIPPILISNVFFETDLRQALEDVASQAGIPIIADETVQGSVTMEVNDLPMEQVLDMLLVAGGFAFKKMEGYYLVGAADPLNPTFSLLSNTEYIKPTYIKAANVESFLPDQFKQYVQISHDQNALAITASPTMIKRIKSLITKVDRKPKQIMLQSVILDLSSTARERLGIDWNWSWNTAYDRTASAESAGAVGLGFDPFQGFSGGGIAEGFGFSFAGTGQLTSKALASIKAVVEDGEGMIRATPRVVTLDGQEASININAEEYVSVTTGPVTYPYTELEIIKYGITLRIVPFISDQGDIIVKILPAEVSDVAGTGADNLPIVVRRTVSTTVRVRNGETIIIGGLIQKHNEEKIEKVPVLGDIPLLGWMFKNKTYEAKDSEIMVLITPRILEEALRTAQR